MAYALWNSRDAIARVNITPMADVMAVLLAIVLNLYDARLRHAAPRRRVAPYPGFPFMTSTGSIA